MKKEFTAEDILLKHNTNIKSATTAILLSGILGLIYLVRFIISKNLNFFFSLSFTDMLLRYGQEKGSLALPVIISLIYILGFSSLAVFSGKKTGLLKLALGIYAFDFLCLIGSICFIFSQPVDSSVFIDVIVHLFVIVFISAGIYSARKIKN